MADQKISALTAKTTPVAADLLALVDTEATPDETKQITWANLFKGPTITTPTINGTIATTGLTLPAVTLGGTITAGGARVYTGGAGTYFNDYVSFGNVTTLDTYTYPAANKILSVANSSTIADNNTLHGLSVTIEAAKTSAAYTSSLVGGIVQSYIKAASNQNFTNASYGLVGFANHVKTEIGSTGIVTWAMGNQSFGEFDGASATNFASYKALAPVGTIGTVYQFYAEKSTVGSTANYDFYGAGGLNYFGGHVGIGIAPTTDRVLNLVDIETIADNNPHIGALIQKQVAKTSAAFTNVIMGVSAQGAVAAGNTQNWSGARGLKTLVAQSYVLDGATGTITGVADITAGFYTGATTTTNRYGLYIEDTTGAGTLTNQYGVYFENLAKGGTLNYMIHGAADITFGMGINLATSKVFKINSVQVVGAQGAVVADATDAASVILRLNDLLARCRAHGLIAT